jgi:hypothetical protein
MQTRTTPPLARTEALVVEELGDELLVYDLTRDEAHSLGTVAAKVWKACDGEKNIDKLAAELGMDHDAVAEAVEGLDTCNLLDVAPEVEEARLLTRRGLSLKAVKLGAAATAVPLIVSIAAPTAAMAVTEAFCASILAGHGCGDCHKFGCCCCEPPAGSTKPCHADCVTHPDCNIGTQPNCNGSTPNCKIQGG